MITRSTDRLQVSGLVTMATVSALFKEGLMQQKNSSSNAALSNDVLEIDFAQLDKVDSSAVSLMLVWLREAQRNNVTIRFANVPANLMSLAKLYGVSELLNMDAI